MKLSVVIPARNEEVTLPQVLRDLQTGPVVPKERVQGLHERFIVDSSEE